MYIAYDIKGGVKYAKVCSGRRIDGKVVTSQKSMGRVVDEAKGIYHTTGSTDSSPMISRQVNTQR